MKPNQPIVHVIDDDAAVRDSISMLFDTENIEHVVYASATDFLNAYNDTMCGCLVLDVRMPNMTGLELQGELNKRHSRLPIIFITGHGDIPMAVEAMRRGALDFLRKPFGEDDLLQRVGEALHHAAAAREEHDARGDIRKHFDTLSPREKEVFERIASGQANKVAAIELGISERTVEIHRSQVMKKMGARSLAALVRMKIDLDRETAH